jgi:translation elongation factor EF-G
MTRVPKNVIAVTPAGNITMDHIMGFYTLYTLPNEPVSASKLHRLWISEGLPPDMIPNSRSAKNNFQQAARSIENRSRKTDANKKRTEIEVDPVFEDVNTVIYQVTKLQRDEFSKVIDHPKAMRVTFDKQSEIITWEPLDKLEDMSESDLKGLFDLIQNHFDRNAKKVPGARVRASIRALIKDVGGTPIIRKKQGGAGGVYFVPKDGKDYLDSAETVLTGLYGEDAEMHLIFAASADGERELVERHFTTNVSEEIDGLMAEVKGALESGEKGRSMRKDRVGNILAQRKLLGENREKYASLLDTSLEEIGTKLDLLDQQLESLVLNTNADD